MVADVMEEIFRPPAYAGYQHERFAIVEIIPEAYEEHFAYIRSLNTEGYQEPEGLVWQYDGVEWPQPDVNRGSGPLKLGQQAIMPLLVAEHGIKSTKVWHHRDVVDPETGVVVGRKPNYRTAGKAMLRIVKIIDPGSIQDMVKREAGKQQPVATPALCPWCQKEVPQIDFKAHVQAEHFGGLPAEAQKESIHEAAMRLSG